MIDPIDNLPSGTRRPLAALAVALCLMLAGLSGCRKERARDEGTQSETVPVDWNQPPAGQTTRPAPSTRSAGQTSQPAQPIAAAPEQTPGPQPPPSQADEPSQGPSVPVPAAPQSPPAPDTSTAALPAPPAQTRPPGPAVTRPSQPVTAPATAPATQPSPPALPETLPALAQPLDDEDSPPAFTTDIDAFNLQGLLGTQALRIDLARHYRLPEGGLVLALLDRSAERSLMIHYSPDVKGSQQVGPKHAVRAWLMPTPATLSDAKVGDMWRLVVADPPGRWKGDLFELGGQVEFTLAGERVAQLRVKRLATTQNVAPAAGRLQERIEALDKQMDELRRRDEPSDLDRWRFAQLMRQMRQLQAVAAEGPSDPAAFSTGVITAADKDR
jgi:hypothetical protein